MFFEKWTSLSVVLAFLICSGFTLPGEEVWITGVSDTAALESPGTDDLSGVGSWPWGPSFAVETDGTSEYVFLGSGGGVHLLYFSSPGQDPVLLGEMKTEGRVRGLFFHETPYSSLLFIAAGAAGLEIWDVSSPETPCRLGSHDTSGETWDVHVVDELAYLADGGCGLRVINVADPASPQEIGWCDTPGYSRQVDCNGEYAFVADNGSMKVISVADPCSPYVAATCGNNCTYGLVLSGDLVYAAGYQQGLWVIDVSVPGSPEVLGSYPCFGLTGLSCGDQKVYAASSGGMAIFDVSDASNPQKLASWSGEDFCFGIALSDGHVFLSDGSAGLQVVDVSIGYLPEPVNSWDTPGYTNSAALSGNYAFLLNQCLIVLDVSDMENPAVVGNVSTRHTPCQAALSGNILCIAEYGGGLEIMDVGDPWSPQSLGFFETTGTWCSDVAIWEGYAVIVEMNGGTDSPIRVIDISQPEDPFEVGSCGVLTLPWDLRIQGDHAYVADYGEGLRIFHLLSGADPVLAGTWNGDGDELNVDVSGDHAFLTARGLGTSYLYSLNVSNPSAPFTEACISFPGEPQSIALSGDTALVSVEEGGIHIIDVSDPASPSLIGCLETPGSARDVTVNDDLVFVADGETGLRMFQWSAAAAEEELAPVETSGFSLRAGANPTGSRTASVTAVVPRESLVRLSLFDVSGRLVHSDTAVLSPGEHLFQCSGLPAGVYSAVLSAVDARVSMRMTVLP